MAVPPALFTLKTYRDPWDAHILRGRLAAEGIPAFVFNENHVWVNWPFSTALGGVRVQVPTNLAAEASDVWNAIADGSCEAELARLFGGLDSERCPVCGSEHARKAWPPVDRIVVGLLLTLLGLPVKVSLRRRVCATCGARWTT